MVREGGEERERGRERERVNTYTHFQHMYCESPVIVLTTLLTMLSGLMSSLSMFDSVARGYPCIGFNFHGHVHSHPLCNVQLNLFRGFNFHGYR